MALPGAAVAPHPGCLVSVPQPCRATALALLCSPKVYQLCLSLVWTSLGAGFRWWLHLSKVPSGFPAGAVASATRILALHAPVALPSPCAWWSVIAPARFPSGPGAWFRLSPWGCVQRYGQGMLPTPQGQGQRCRHRLNEGSLCT